MLLLSGVGVAITETGSSDSYLHDVTVVPPGLWAALFSSLQGRRFHQGPQGEIQMLTDGVWVSESSRGNILGDCSLQCFNFTVRGYALYGNSITVLGLVQVWDEAHPNLTRAPELMGCRSDLPRFNSQSREKLRV